MGEPPQWAKGPHSDVLSGIIVRPSADGTIDEIVCDQPVRFHLERIGAGQCWLGLTLPDGQVQKILLESHDTSMYATVNT